MRILNNEPTSIDLGIITVGIEPCTKRKYTLSEGVYTTERYTPQKVWIKYQYHAQGPFDYTPPINSHASTHNLSQGDRKKLRIVDL